MYPHKTFKCPDELKKELMNETYPHESGKGYHFQNNVTVVAIKDSTGPNKIIFKVEGNRPPKVNYKKGEDHFTGMDITDGCIIADIQTQK